MEEFRDGFTTTRFGDAVTVTTFLGIPQVCGVCVAGGSVDGMGSVRPFPLSPNMYPSTPHSTNRPRQAVEDEDRRDEEEARARKQARNPRGVDRAQQQAGSVERFKRLLVGKMPGA